MVTRIGSVLLTVGFLAYAQQFPDLLQITMPQRAPLPGAPLQGTPDTNAAAPAGSYTLGGIVVNGATGEPVARALVHLNTQGSKMTMTGPDGRFQFEGLPAGAAIVFAQKPGYFTPQETGLGSGTYPVIQIGKDSTDVKLNLYPTGSITGRVTSVGADPIEGMRVKAMYLHVVDGRTRYEERGAATTDDAGLYRISGLVPGRYYVATLGGPVRTLSSGVRSYGENFDLVYPAVYFSGGSDLASGAPLVVSPGEQAEADFSESPQKAYTVSGTVNGSATERTSLSLLDQDGNQVQARLERRGPAFTFHNVLPGDYQIFANSISRGNEAMYGAVPVSVGAADVPQTMVELSPSTTILIQTEWDKPTADNQQRPVQVRLLPSAHNALNQGFWSRTDLRDGQPVALFERVIPGAYRVKVALNGQGYVSAVRSGQSDLAQNELIVTAGSPAPAIQISFHSGGATLTGTIAGGRQSLSVYLVVVPDNPLSPVEISPIPVSGQFNVSGLPPGAYRVYGFTSIDGLEYHNPEAMRRYDSQSVTVSLTENETRQIDVPLASGGPT